MAGKREAKREDLRKRLLEAATHLINEKGVKELNAREVTTRAGCALGSLYTAYEDLDDLIVHVNSRTLMQLGESLRGRVEGISGPVEIMKGLASGYVAFARAHYRLWSALFEYAEMTMEVPSWHQEDQSFLITFICGPVMELSPHLSEEEAMRRSRTLFAAVHGIITFSLQKRYIGLADDELEGELNRFIDQLVEGLGTEK